MAITLRELCKYTKENYAMKLLCGESNMNNLVNWVHMLEDPETATFLHGQELIFTTGIGHESTDWLTDFVKLLVANGASGLVINIGPYIAAVPDPLLAYCKQVQFPLLTIPWSTRIVDITNDFCRKIIKAEENEITFASAFKNAIFFPENTSEYRSVLERKEFDLDAQYCVVAVSLQVPSNDQFLEYEKVVRLHLNKILHSYGDRFGLFKQDKFLIVVLQSFPIESIENALERLQVICNFGDEAYKIRVGISENDFGIVSLSRNYKRALSVLNFAQKQEKDLASYRNIGFYQLLIEVEEPEVLRRFYKDTLGQLADYDVKNGTDYMVTLKVYLDNDASVQEVAKATYVHRNTINYKIKKIKEILQCELSYQDGLKLLFAFHVKELL